MEIYMYNTWFGDCFQIVNDDSDLYVDFGVHKFSYIGNGMNRKRLHKAIADDIEADKMKPSILITHYHEDHISGLTYMLEQHNNNAYKYNHLFDAVYIPDIWNVEGAKNIVALHLLEQLISGYEVKSNISLLDFVEFLCSSTYKVIFTHRGTLLENGRYIALWPDSKILESSATEFIEEYRLVNDSIIQRIIDVSVSLCEIIIERVNDNENMLEMRFEQYYSRITVIRDNLTELLNNRVIEEWSRNEDFVSKLRDFGNKVSIVFHNVEKSIANNILFTGDIESEYLDKIDKNYDSNMNCDMHDVYDYIKVPHHGTYGYKGKHYYNFSKYNPKVLMIPNGKCMNWKISKHYMQNGSKQNNAKVYCSNCNWCEGNQGGVKRTCACNKNELIFPKRKKLVTP